MREPRWMVFFLALSVAVLVPALVFLVVQAYGLPLGVRLGGPSLVWSGPVHAPRAAEEPAPAVRQFRIAMTMLGEGDLEQHRWLPGTIVVNRGDTVILRVTNADEDASHGFAIAGYDIFEPTIPPGGEKTYRFEAKTPGIFLFSCALPGCAEDHDGQVGQLVVLGAP